MWFLQAMWLWAPFAQACVGRASMILSVVLWVEGRVFALMPHTLWLFTFYTALAYIALGFVQQAYGSATAGPTPDMRVAHEAGSFRSDTVTWATCDMRGWRPHMEDAHVAEMLDSSLFPDAAMFAVFDGHGGKEVSRLASKLVTREVSLCGQELQAEGDGRLPSLADALNRALPRLDAKMRAGSFGIGRVLPTLLHPFAHCGSTACVAAVDFTTHEVLVANVGDSRAILIRDGKAIALSEDHKPENPIERSRIRAAGGEVIKVGPCHRVDGNLNLSRALGDFNLKANGDLPPEEQKVSAFPDTTRTPFQGGPQELLVVGCDGLFERLSNQALADIIWPRVKAGLPLTTIGTELLHVCCARSSRGRPMEMGTDNETVILVKLPLKQANGDCASDSELHAGQRVEIHSLESEAGQLLNGQIGILEGPSQTLERFDVRMIDAGYVKSFKAANLRPCLERDPAVETHKQE